MSQVVFVIVLIVCFLGVVGLLMTIRYPKIHIWPPPQKRSLQFVLAWLFSVIAMGGIPIVGGLDWGSLGYDHVSRFWIGGILLVLGVFLGVWGVQTLSFHQSLGLRGRLITSGPYKYSRNPQYIGYIAIYVGVILVTSSFMALITGMLLLLWFVLAPFTEEPWSRKQYGKEYEAYCEKVPRFL